MSFDVPSKEVVLVQVPAVFEVLSNYNSKEVLINLNVQEGTDYVACRYNGLVS